MTADGRCNLTRWRSSPPEPASALELIVEDALRSALPDESGLTTLVSPKVTNSVRQRRHWKLRPNSVRRSTWRMPPRLVMAAQVGWQIGVAETKVTIMVSLHALRIVLAVMVGAHVDPDGHEMVVPVRITMVIVGQL